MILLIDDTHECTLTDLINVNADLIPSLPTHVIIIVCRNLPVNDERELGPFKIKKISK